MIFFYKSNDNSVKTGTGFFNFPVPVSSVNFLGVVNTRVDLRTGVRGGGPKKSVCDPLRFVTEYYCA